MSYPAKPWAVGNNVSQAGKSRNNVSEPEIEIGKQKMFYRLTEENFLLLEKPMLIPQQ